MPALGKAGSPGRLVRRAGGDSSPCAYLPTHKAMTTLGIALALACAAMANLAMLCKHRGACEAPDISLKTPLHSVRQLFLSRWWTIGFAVAAVAWVLHVAAMSIAPLSLVQAVIA